MLSFDGHKILGVVSLVCVLAVTAGCPPIGPGNGDGSGEGNGEPTVGVFSDPDLLLAVRDELNIPSGPISGEAIAGLTVLDTGGRLFNRNTRELTAIETLLGLEAASNLERLSIPNSLTSSLQPLSGLANLVELRVNPDLLLTSVFENRNLISNLSPLSGLTGLEKLDLRGNEIQFIGPIEGLTNLVELDLANNPLNEIGPLGSLTNLEWLDIGGNRCAACQLNVQLVSIRDLSELRYLGLNGLSLDNLTALASLTNLEFLDLGNNDIINPLALSALTNLRKLDLSRNDISNVSTLSSLVNLEWLNLEAGDGDPRNEVTDITALTGMTELRYLNLRGNPLARDAVCNDIPLMRSRGVVVEYDDTFDCSGDDRLPDSMVGRWEVLDCFNTGRTYILVSETLSDTSGTIHVVVYPPGDLNVPGETAVLGSWALDGDVFTVAVSGAEDVVDLPIVSRDFARFVTGGSLTGGPGCQDRWTRSLVERVSSDSF